jgi:hypothetical protein
MMYPEKYRTDELLQELLKNNTLDQLLYAFDPKNFRQTPQPMPLYDPNGTGQGDASYLDQLLGQQGQQPAAPPAQAQAPQANPLQQLLEEETRKRQMMMDGGGRMDRGGYGGLGMSGY